MPKENWDFKKEFWDKNKGIWENEKENPDYDILLLKEKYSSLFSKFGNKDIEKRAFLIPDVPELEKAAQSHRGGSEIPLSAVRQIILPVTSFREQIGRTCGLTSFRIILGALGKPVPSYEEIMGIPFDQITGSNEKNHRKFLNQSYKDIKETKISIIDFTPAEYPILREAIFKLFAEGNYLYVVVNWQKLHGIYHPNGSSKYDHAIVLSGARETEEPVQGSKINYLITDPNHRNYHDIWISERLLFKAVLNEVLIYGYRIEAPSVKERIKKKLTGARPVAVLQV